MLPVGNHRGNVSEPAPCRTGAYRYGVQAVDGVVQSTKWGRRLMPGSGRVNSVAKRLESGPRLIT